MPTKTLSETPEQRRKRVAAELAELEADSIGNGPATGPKGLGFVDPADDPDGTARKGAELLYWADAEDAEPREHQSPVTAPVRAHGSK